VPAVPVVSEELRRLPRTRTKEINQSVKKHLFLRSVN
jgi:hypothetical protein